MLLSAEIPFYITKPLSTPATGAWNPVITPENLQKLSKVCLSLGQQPNILESTFI